MIQLIAWIGAITGFLAAGIGCSRRAGGSGGRPGGGHHHARVGGLGSSLPSGWKGRA